MRIFPLTFRGGNRRIKMGKSKDTKKDIKKKPAKSIKEKRKQKQEKKKNS
jgi:hypothetical protein